VSEETRVRCFFTPNKVFRVPEDNSLPMIMVGPGTGIAPFRAFLQERQYRNAPGKNWLFFGDRNAATDYIYRDELEGFQQSGLLSRLDLAFSRDQDAKIYVQDRMREQGAELFCGWSRAVISSFVVMLTEWRKMSIRHCMMLLLNTANFQSSKPLITLIN